MLVETLPLFVAQSPLKVSFRFWAAVSEPIGGGVLLGLAPPGLLARSAKIDDRSHR
jgi:hypothetical protein